MACLKRVDCLLEFPKVLVLGQPSELSIIIKRSFNLINMPRVISASCQTSSWQMWTKKMNIRSIVSILVQGDLSNKKVKLKRRTSWLVSEVKSRLPMNIFPTAKANVKPAVNSIQLSKWVTKIFSKEEFSPKSTERIRNN